MTLKNQFLSKTCHVRKHTLVADFLENTLNKNSNTCTMDIKIETIILVKLYM